MLRVRHLLFSFLLLLPAHGARAQSEMTATYARHVLELVVPYAGLHPGSGHLAVDLLSPEDQVLAHSDYPVTVAAGGGQWKADLVPDVGLAFDDLVWQRVRYRFNFENEPASSLEQVRSVSTILRHPVVRLLGQREFLAESTAALRVLVSDGTLNATPISGAVRIDLVQEGQRTQTLFSGKLDQRGSVNAEFRFPAGLTGDVSLRIVAQTALGTAETVQKIHLQDKVSILLTTEKPIYRPSQTIHVRPLALDRSDHSAASDRKLIFELEDARGNKVFRKQTETDSFGVASAEFALADEVNLGSWHLHASLQAKREEAKANTAELAFQVERYVLPKFLVSIGFTPKDGKPQRDFRPGDHVTGTAEAKYFFGKPVAGASIDVKSSLMDAALFTGARTEGHTDAEGRYAFDLTLPSYVAGRGGNHGSAPVVIEATVKDTAGHTESRGESVTVTDTTLFIQAVAEGGRLIPGLDNVVYLLTSYPDGTPASTTVRLHTQGNNLPTVETSSNGVAILHLAGNASNEQLRCEADDHFHPRSGLQLFRCAWRCSASPSAGRLVCDAC